jgi:hypothetical protein
MKKNVLLRTIMVLAAGLVALCGCAALSPVPEGSVLTGVYEGSFNGKYDWGGFEVKLYRTPGGTLAFFGTFSESFESSSFCSGQVANGKMVGTLLQPIDGTILGNLSEDGRSMSGTFKINDPPFDHGTWNAHKR